MDPNAPRPEGNLMTPIGGEELLVRDFFSFLCCDLVQNIQIFVYVMIKFIQSVVLNFLVFPNLLMFFPVSLYLLWLYVTHVLFPFLSMYNNFFVYIFILLQKMSLHGTSSRRKNDIYSWNIMRNLTSSSGEKSSIPEVGGEERGVRIVL